MARGYFCPRCLERIAPDAVAYRTRDLQPAEKPRTPYQRGPLEWSRALWHGDPRSLYRIDPKAQAEIHRQGVHARCAQNHRIPAHAFDIPSIVVGLLGEKSAGKTVYLGTLLELLDRGRLLPYLGFHPDEHTGLITRELFGPFYRDGTPPLGTNAGRGERHREALTLTAETDGREEFYLSFFDASGEQLELAHQGSDNTFLYVADVVMHFITPESLGLTRRRPHRRDDQLQDWHQTKDAVRAATRTAQPNTHAAVIIPKSDDIDPDAIDLLRDARADLDYGHGLSLVRAHQVIEDDSHYIRDMLRLSDDGRVLVDLLEKAYRSVTYHLVSATGEPLAEAYGRFLQRRPQRVLDPLLASLAQVGVLDVRQGRRAFR